MSFFVFKSYQKVQFYDCDPMGVVWHGNYLKFLELARGEFLSAIGYSYQNIAEDNFYFPIVEERTKYVHSLRLSDEFVVEASLDEYINRMVFSFEIKCNDILCVKSRTVQVALPIGSSELSFFMPNNFVKAVDNFLQKNNCEIANR